MENDVKNSMHLAAMVAAQRANEGISRRDSSDPRASQQRFALAFTHQLTQAFAEASRQAQVENARLGLVPKPKNRNLKLRSAAKSRAPKLANEQR